MFFVSIYIHHAFSQDLNRLPCYCRVLNHSYVSVYCLIIDVVMVSMLTAELQLKQNPWIGIC